MVWSGKAALCSICQHCRGSVSPSFCLQSWWGNRSKKRDCHTLFNTGQASMFARCNCESARERLCHFICSPFHPPFFPMPVSHTCKSPLLYNTCVFVWKSIDCEAKLPATNVQYNKKVEPSKNFLHHVSKLTLHRWFVSMSYFQLC